MPSNKAFLDSAQLYGLACPRCARLLTVTGTREAATGTCVGCRRRVAVRLDPKDETRGIVAKTVRVAIPLTRPVPSAAEVMALRKLVPEWRGESLETIRTRLSGAGEWVLDDVSDFEVERLRQRATELGLAPLIRPEPTSLWRRIAGPRTVRLTPARLVVKSEAK